MIGDGIEVVGDSARRWIERSLEGGLSISRFVLEDRMVASMRVIALVPAQTPTAAFDHLDRGGVVGSEADSLLLRFVQDRCRGHRRLLIVEDELAQTSDAWMRDNRLRFPYFTSEGDVYHVLEMNENLETQDLDDFLSESTSGYPTNIFLLGGSVTDTPSGELDLGAIRALASATDSVIVSAFDNEGFLAAVPARQSAEPLRARTAK